MKSSYYWYDLETFGIDPKYYRVAQFAGIRTDLDLNVISKPAVFYCQPTPDYLPDPTSCLVTQITPQLALQKGIKETDFYAKILSEFVQPNTCVAGYNNIRFDDEHIRYGLYRNLYDPYAREWQNGNSRWDIIDMLRLTRALRPGGINWPLQEDDTPSFKLTDITSANNIEHLHAHDALSDVMATIAVAKLIKDKQAKLYQYVLNNRSKHAVANLLNIKETSPVLHISSMYPATRGCAAVVAPIAIHPNNRNGYIVYDLSVDPRQFVNLGVDELRDRLFTPRRDLDEGIERLPIKTIHINKCPIVVPLKTLDELSAQRLGIDLVTCDVNLATLKLASLLQKNIMTVLAHEYDKINIDPDCALYQGFFNDSDRIRMQHIHQRNGTTLINENPVFDDKRLPELFFRYKARNYPESLTEVEKERWDSFRLSRLIDDNGGEFINQSEFYSVIQQLRSKHDTSNDSRKVLDQLEEYAQYLIGN